MPLFPENQIDREKLVILEEMSMYKDTPEDAIQDDFDEVVFGHHALGKNILGTEETVNSFKQEHFINFIQRNLNTTKIVVSSVGNYPIKKLERLTQKYLGEIPFKNHTQSREAFKGFQVESKTATKPASQVHVAMGHPAYALRDDRRIPLFMLTNILGGPYMNSRLNLSLREKNGFVYNIEAGYNSFTDVGLFSLFFATDPRHLKKSLRLVNKELAILRDKPMSSVQLQKAKQQIKGHLAMSEENNNAIMLMMAKSLLDLNIIPSLPSVFEKIDQIQPGLLQE